MEPPSDVSPKEGERREGRLVRECLIYDALPPPAARDIISVRAPRGAATRGRGRRLLPLPLFWTPSSVSPLLLVSCLSPRRASRRRWRCIFSFCAVTEKRKA